MNLLPRLAHILLLTLTFVCFPLIAFSAEKNTRGIVENTLGNGLKVLVKPDHRSPVTVFMICYHLGSAYEQEGKTGIAHVLEHMMFKGTEKIPAGEFSKKIASYGGNDNAFTHQDYTCYFQQIAAKNLGISFELEADRMQNIKFTPEDFNKEKQVVMEERRMRIEDNPQATTFERFQAIANTRFGYQHPIIGWMEDIKNLTLEDAYDWYNRWYQPSRATVIVIGDISAKQVLQLAQKYFGSITKTALIATPIIHDIPAPGLRKLHVRIPAKLPMTVVGVNVPSLATATDKSEAYALEVIAALLAGSDSARLTKELVRNQAIASQVDVYYDLSKRMSGLFVVLAMPSANTSNETLNGLLLKQLEAFKKQPVSKAELDRVKRQVIAHKVYSQDSLFYQAEQLGTLEAAGLSWKTDEEYATRIGAITPQKIQEVAKKYFNDDRMTLAFLEPTAEK